MEEVVGTLQRANTVLLEAQGALRGSGSSLRFIQERVEEVSDARWLPGNHPESLSPVCVPQPAELVPAQGGGLGVTSLLTWLSLLSDRGCPWSGREERGGHRGRAGRAALAAAARH